MIAASAPPTEGEPPALGQIPRQSIMGNSTRFALPAFFAALFFAALFIAPAPVAAQFGFGGGSPDEGKVEATILDSEGLPVAGSNVMIAWDEPAAEGATSPRESFAGEADESGALAFWLAPRRATLRAFTPPAAPKNTESGALLAEAFGPVDVEIVAGQTAYALLAPAGPAEVLVRLKPSIPGDFQEALLVASTRRFDPADFAMLGAPDRPAVGALLFAPLRTDRPTILRFLPEGEVWLTAVRLTPDGPTLAAQERLDLVADKPAQSTLTLAALPEDGAGDFDAAPEAETSGAVEAHATTPNEAAGE